MCGKCLIQGLSLVFVPIRGWNAECTGHIPPPGDSVWVVYVTPSTVPTQTKFYGCSHVQRSPLSPLLPTNDLDFSG